jgi:hypothetical protein
MSEMKITWSKGRHIENGQGVVTLAELVAVYTQLPTAHRDREAFRKLLVALRRERLAEARAIEDFLDATR